MAKKKKVITKIKEVEKLTGKYWRRNTFIMGVGTVCGMAKQSDIDSFVNQAVEGTDLDKWLSDTDVHSAFKQKKRKNAQKINS